ncbi:hypothetical protein [uncultured Psychroserpens sp.]|uniref:hypothetical protein n=1 Tax=uncultured Psychroserpens sp. TaxID=255436 RepID=UPI002617EBB6|nr:hypothetical protein [uncultured Psychroserpens sp.]
MNKLMPTYPPRNTATKKNQILNYKIFEFLSLLDVESTEEKKNKKAEEVRIAMLNLIKARITLNKSYKSDDENKNSIQLRKKLSINKTNWESYTYDDIKDYCEKNGK